MPLWCKDVWALRLVNNIWHSRKGEELSHRLIRPETPPNRKNIVVLEYNLLMMPHRCSSQKFAVALVTKIARVEL